MPLRRPPLAPPIPAGGGADFVARLFGDKLVVLLGQRVVIDNEPSATGNIGAETVARGPADGYTVLMANEFLSTNPLMFKSIAYDALRDPDLALPARSRETAMDPRHTGCTALASTAGATTTGPLDASHGGRLRPQAPPPRDRARGVTSTRRGATGRCSCNLR